MTNSTLVSIIMPVYNNEKFILEAVDSIVKQTYADFELIIIDDASTDNTVNQIDSFRDNRIKLLQNHQHEGISSSLNKGIKLCNGELIARMDGDDVSSSSRLQKQVDYLKSNPDISICGSNIILINADGSFICEHNYNSDDEKIKTDLFFGKTSLAHPAIMFRKSMIEQFGTYDQSFDYAEDYELYCRLSPNISFHNMQDHLLLYRQHSASVSNSHTYQQRMLARSALKEHIKYYGIDCNETEFQAHCSFYLKVSEDEVSMQDIMKWTACLLEINQNKHYFPNEYFISQIKRWRRKCAGKEI